MVPPIHPSLAPDDLASRGLPGVITITATERVNNWNQKILKRFRRLVNNSEEAVLNHVIKDYYRLVNEQITYLKERHLLREKLANHMHTLHLSYKKLNRQQLIKTTFYLDTIEQLLCFVCDLELEVVSLMKRKPAPILSQTIVYTLQLYLSSEPTRILHVLLKLNDRYVDRESYKGVMNLVYKYFLVTVPPVNNTDMNFCLYYLLYQRWKITKPEDTHAAMEKYVYFQFSKDPVLFKDTKLGRRILKPYISELPNGVVKFVNGFGASISQYFKCYEQSRDLLASSNVQNNSKVRKSCDIYDLDFVQSAMYTKRDTLKNGNAVNLVLMPPPQEEIVVIDDDSDVEFITVPVVEQEVTTIVVDTIEDPMSPPTSSDGNSPTTSADGNSPITSDGNSMTSVDTSKLIPLFNSISIDKIKEANAQKGNLFPEWACSNKDTSEKHSEIIKFLESIFDDMNGKANNTTEKNSTAQIEIDATSNVGTSAEVIDEIKELEADSPTCSIEMNSINDQSEMITEDSVHQVEETCELPLHAESNVEESTLQEVQKTNVNVNETIANEIETKITAEACNYCACRNAESKQMHDSKEIELVTKPACKSVEIQTDDAISEVYNFRTAMETPPSDLEPSSPTNDAYPFINPVIKYIEDDNYKCISAIYDENGSLTLKQDEFATQVYADELDITHATQEDIKPQSESFANYHYVATDMQAEESVPDENIYLNDETEEEAHLLLMNNTAINITDCLKMPLLQSEILDINVKNDIDGETDVAYPEENTDLANATEHQKVVASISVKRRIGRKQKNPFANNLADTNISSKIENEENPTYPLSEFDKFTTQPDVLADTYGTPSSDIQSSGTSTPSSSLDITESVEAIDVSKTTTDVVTRDLSPSPAYEVIPAQEFRNHLKEEKKRKRSGILKHTKTINDDASYDKINTSEDQNNIDISHSRRSISTRAAAKRKKISSDDEPLPKCKKVNFSDTDTIVHIPREQPRRISHSIVEQAKDSMCINNVLKQDNKLVYLEPCIPVNIMPFSKFLEDHKMRQINSYNKNMHNMFFNRAISFKEESSKATIQRIDYKKFQKNGENAFSNTLVKYPTITFRASNDSASQSAEIPIDFGTDGITLEIRTQANQSTCDRYQEKEMPIKKRRIPTTSDFTLENNYLCVENLTNSEGSMSLLKKIPLKVNTILPSNLELYLVLVCEKEHNNCDTVLPNSENLAQDAVLNCEAFREECYPAGPVMSIADLQENLQNRTFKTPAERKEFPALFPYCHSADPEVIFSEAMAPIFTEQCNITNHTYHSPTINYHLNSVPVPVPMYNMTYYPDPRYFPHYGLYHIDSSPENGTPLTDPTNSVIKKEDKDP